MSYREIKSRRTFMGKVVQLLFIGFQIFMFVWLFGSLAQISELANEQTSQVARTGVEVGAVIGVGLILFVWALGSVVVGIPVMLTRPAKALVRG